MTPYYDHEGIRIFNCDNRDLSPSGCHCMITDPPYGLQLGLSNNQKRSSGYGGHLGKTAYRSYNDSYENFIALIVPRLTSFINTIDRSAVFTGPHIHEQAKPSAIGGIFSPAATGRTPWGSKNFLPILFYGSPPLPGRHRPTVHYTTDASEGFDHPCPKPLSWMRWLVSLVSNQTDLILDPFCGSGATLEAAKILGRRAIGIEIEERYCEVAAKRLSQEVFRFEETAKPDYNYQLEPQDNK